MCQTNSLSQDRLLAQYFPQATAITSLLHLRMQCLPYARKATTQQTQLVQFAQPVASAMVKSKYLVVAHPALRVHLRRLAALITKTVQTSQQSVPMARKCPAVIV